jgi:hypothetical protein
MNVSVFAIKHQIKNLKQKATIYSQYPQAIKLKDYLSKYLE